MSMPKPRVSVMIPTYNRAGFISAAIDSVLAQTYTDFEIIVVDDGSTDDTREVLRKYGDRVRYTRIENSGPARARNVGMEMAQGEYLCLLDSDDLYYPHKLALQVDYLDRHPDLIMVYTDFSAFDDAGYSDEFHMKTYHRSAFRQPGCTYEKLFTEHRPLTENAILRAAAQDARAPHWLERSEHRGELYESYLYNMIVFTNSMMFRREVLAASGLQDPYFGQFHDMEFALRVCKAGKVAFIDNPTYKLRYHPGQISTLQNPKGELTNVNVQRGMLRVARRHACERGYYERNRGRVDRLVAGLCRAAAVPMIAYGGDNTHLRKYLPRRARRYLARGARHGGRALDLYLVSYLPTLAKRVYFRLWGMWRATFRAAT